MTDKPAKSSTKPIRSGLKRLVRAVEARGFDAIDRRSSAYREVARWRADVAAALGGEDSLSPQRISLLEDVACTRLFLNHANSFILELGTVVNRRNRKILAVVTERTRLSELFMKQLGQLGLDRVEKVVDFNPAWIERVRPNTHTEESSVAEKESELASEEKANEERAGRDIDAH